MIPSCLRQFFPSALLRKHPASRVTTHQEHQEWHGAFLRIRWHGQVVYPLHVVHDDFGGWVVLSPLVDTGCPVGGVQTCADGDDERQDYQGFLHAISPFRGRRIRPISAPRPWPPPLTRNRSRVQTCRANSTNPVWRGWVERKATSKHTQVMTTHSPSGSRPRQGIVPDPFQRAQRPLDIVNPSDTQSSHQVWPLAGMGAS